MPRKFVHLKLRNANPDRQKSAPIASGPPRYVYVVNLLSYFYNIGNPELARRSTWFSSTNIGPQIFRDFVSFVFVKMPSVLLTDSISFELGGKFVEVFLICLCHAKIWWLVDPNYLIIYIYIFFFFFVCMHFASSTSIKLWSLGLLMLNFISHMKLNKFFYKIKLIPLLSKFFSECVG